MNAEQRVVVGLGLVLVATLELYLTPGPSFLTSAIWFICAIAIGMVLGSWWSLLLAFIPWPLQMAAGLVSGRYAYFGEAWEFVALGTAVCGLVGIAIGIILSRFVVSGWQRSHG